MTFGGKHAVRIALIALNAIGFAAILVSMLIMWSDKPERDRNQGTIVPTPSGETVDVPELRYTFVMPTGFVLSPYAHKDANLVPAPWLPTFATIELASRELGANINSSDAAERFARSDLLEQRVGEPIEALSAADGSPAIQYRVSGAESLYTVVFHGHFAVFLHTKWDFRMNEAQRAVLREATVTVVRGMRFR